MQKLTLEERLDRAARSQAASPESAVRMVRQLARTDTAVVLAGRKNLERLDFLIGESLEALGKELLHYGGFCRGFLMAMEASGGGPEERLFRPAMGWRTNSAVVQLGLILLDHARGRRSDRSVYHCTRMTLGQYVDALSRFFLGGGEIDRKFQDWRDCFVSCHDLSVPLADALADSLRQYAAGLWVLKRLDGTIECMECLSRYLEAADPALREVMRQGGSAADAADPAEWAAARNACETFYLKARGGSETAPDPDEEDDLGDVLLLPDRDFSPRALEALVPEAPSPEFRALLEEQIDPNRLADAMAKVNTEASDLFMLWAGAYVQVR